MLGPYSIYKGEKEETVELPDDISLWPQEIMDTLLQVSPYLSNVNLAINLFYIHEEDLNGFGVVEGQVGDIAFEIPIVITKKQLHPLDVFFVDGEAYPLTPAVLDRVLTQRSSMGNQAAGKVDPFKQYKETLPIGYSDVRLPSKRASEYISHMIDQMVAKEKRITWEDGFIYKVASQDRAEEVINTIERDYMLSARFREIYPDLYKESHFVAYAGRFPEDVWIFNKKDDQMFYKRANDRAFVPVKNDVFLRMLTIDKKASYRYDNNTYIIDTRLDNGSRVKLIDKIASTQATQTVNADGDYLIPTEKGILGIKVISKLNGYNGKPTNLIIGIIPEHNRNVISDVEYVIATDFDVLRNSNQPIDFKTYNVSYNTFVRELEKAEKPSVYSEILWSDAIIPIRVGNNGMLEAWLPLIEPRITAYRDANIVVMLGQTIFGRVRLVWGKDNEQLISLPKGTEFAPGSFVDDTPTILMPSDVLIVRARAKSPVIKSAANINNPISVSKNAYDDWKIDLTSIGGPKSDDYSLSKLDVVSNLIKCGFDSNDIVQLISEPTEYYVEIEKTSAVEASESISPPKMPIDIVAKSAVSIGKKFPSIGKFIFSLLYVSPENINQYNKAISQIVDALDVMVKFLVLARLGNIKTDINSLKTAIEYTADFLTKLNKLPYQQVAPSNVIAEEREQTM